jgi:hypothetical protein
MISQKCRELHYMPLIQSYYRVHVVSAPYIHASCSSYLKKDCAVLLPRNVKYMIVSACGAVQMSGMCLL